jgi:hypothetical protein
MPAGILWIRLIRGRQQAPAKAEWIKRCGGVPFSSGFQIVLHICQIDCITHQGQYYLLYPTTPLKAAGSLIAVSGMAAHAAFAGNCYAANIFCAGRALRFVTML